MKKLILIATLFTIMLAGSNQANAQKFRVTMPPGYNTIVQGEELPGVEGSQYLSKDWVLGTINLDDSSTIDPIKLRLNAFKGEMHYQYQNMEYIIGAPDKIRQIIMGTRKFIYGAYLNDGTVSRNYFEVLVEGKTELLVLYYITRKPATYNKAMDTGEKNDQLILSERFYIRNETNIIELDKKGTELTKLMGSKSEQIKKQIDDENLSFKKKEDLIKIVSYMNSTN